MNILPKKRWHVRNKDNKARVQRDELEAVQHENELKRKAAFAEQEAKLDLLRSKSAHKREAQLCCADQDVPAKRHGNINLFESKDTEGASGLGNEEHEKEKRTEQEDYEKRLGVLTYLGQSQLAPPGRRVWDLNSAAQDDCDDGKWAKKQQKEKKRHDPLTTMEKHREKQSKANKHQKINMSRKEKVLPVSKGASIDQLRAERFAREREERQRIKSVLLSGVDSVAVEDDSRQRYSSQYNPHLVRHRK